MKVQQTGIRKKGFPIGIFLMLLIIESAIAIAGTTGYFYYSTRKQLDAVVSYTRNYSETLGEAFTELAEVSYQARNFTPLKTLFREKIRENTINEAFFVLKDGTIVAHSSADIEKNLEGNIANDEFAYNLDMILMPVRGKVRELQFNNYNYMAVKMPFNRQQRDLIQKYLYKDVKSKGWLVTRAVFKRGEPVGSVNFLISKERIYETITHNFREAQDVMAKGVAGAFLVSLMVSIIIFIRYRSIQSQAIAQARRVDADEKDTVAESIRLEDAVMEPASLHEEGKSPEPSGIQSGDKEEVRAVRREDDEPYITIEWLGEIEEPSGRRKSSQNQEVREVIVPVSEDRVPGRQKGKIRDAVPIRERSH